MRPGIRLAAVLILASRCGLAADFDAFEKEIRPLLIAKCAKCHGAEKQKGGLRVDSLAAMVQGGAEGPAIVPGRPEESLLIAAVRREGELKMPPEKGLDPESVAALERWVRSGAPWPETKGAQADARSEAWRKHWAFQPIGNPAPPKTRDAHWSRNTIDAFVLARLEASDLGPSPPADRRTLIRRATYDLTGLPPSPIDVEAFVRDPDPGAYEKLVDRLLASTAYGEQWARHWLDVARYSDTKGYVYAREERFFVQASAYRDWVVRAFNRDMPYDRFLLLQVAADRAAPGDRPSLAAMGFLTLGRRFLGVTHDIIDDRIDVVTRGTMGMTVGCARCHDHKFDPIPTADYYSLYGVFQNSIERTTRLDDPPSDAASRPFEKELAKRQQALAKAMSSARAEASERARGLVASYLAAQTDLSKVPEEGFDVVLGKDDLIPAFVRRWTAYLARSAKAGDPVFVPWHKYAAIKEGEFPRRAAEVARDWNRLGGPKVNPLVAKAFASPPASMKEVAERYGRLFAEVDRHWRERPLASVGQFGAWHLLAGLPDPDAEALRQVLYGPRSPCQVPDEPMANAEWFFDSGKVVELWKIEGEVDRWLVQSPEAPPHAVAVLDRTDLQEPRVFRRGNPATRGDEIPRHFLTALAGPDPKPFTTGSGRLDLARAIVDPGNPLTARVWANRVWLHHFGAGLVRTPSDFGLRAEPPTHPELLDWLARRLISGGWSTKALHRLILLSATYQQRSDTSASEHAKSVDPENRLLWRTNPHRLTFEEMRDTLLAASGELDRKVGGRAAELFPAGGSNTRRTLYGLVDRQFLPGVLRVFDFANPDLHIPARSETSVPQQALFALNHPFVADRARALAARTAKAGDPSARVRALYKFVYQRDPTESQLRAALAFVDASAPESRAPSSPEARAWSYGHGEVDAAGLLRSFHPLPHFTGSAWQGGPSWPDPALGWVQLTATGGHAGNDLQHAAVRRWTAPRDATVSIKSTATHEVKAGDGIRCRIISGRLGVLKSAEVHNKKEPLDAGPISVKAGDTLDFVVDLRANLNSDQYLWSPEIREAPSSSPTWDASRDFVGPPTPRLGPWDELAQVLLLGNELMFVD